MQNYSLYNIEAKKIDLAKKYVDQTLIFHDKLFTL